MRTTHHTLGLLALMALTPIGCGGQAPTAEALQPVDTLDLVARPSALDFGSIAVGSASTQNATLTNTGREQMDVTGVFPPDPCRAVLLQPCIRPGESTALSVTCAPSVAGAFRGTVSIRYQSRAGAFERLVPVSGLAVTR